jgi:hypothetical protein
MQAVEIGLADLDPLTAQDGKGHGSVEQEVRHPEQVQETRPVLIQIGEARPVPDAPHLGPFEFGRIKVPIRARNPAMSGAGPAPPGTVRPASG